MVDASQARNAALDLIAYIHQSPTPFHAVYETARRAQLAGFRCLDEKSAWKLDDGQAYCVICDGSIVLWRMGTSPMENAGLRVIGAHTDSPNLRVKPMADVHHAGYAQVGVELYGSLLAHTWVDRDLGVAGRVVSRSKQGLVCTLVRIDKPLLRVPTLAIHLDRGVREEGVKLNPQDHMQPVLGMEGANKNTLRRLVADAADVDPTEIYGFDLSLFDLNPPCLGGVDSAYIFSARLDNQAMCHAALCALCAAHASPITQMVCLYDHEEVGSESHAGAGGALAERVIERLLPTPEKKARALSQSWQLSADMAHAVHPNYEHRHEPEHRPRMGFGPVVKINTQQRYATCGQGEALFAALCEDAGTPCQRFVVRSDLPCGSTIGPITAARLGIRTVDVGNPMLSMHSIREQAGSSDHGVMIDVMTRFFLG
jgi:aspartyl aminopeptidase